ncbi:MAG: GDSL-type esterase/lipase family protein [Bacteroidota bacterium]
MKKLLIIYYALAILLVAGFTTHSSDTPAILFYSTKYFLFLAVLAIVLLGIIPWWLNRYVSQNGTKNLLMASVPSIITLVLIYLAGHYYYYYQQEHLFDPFLQMPPNDYEFSSEKDSTTFRVLCLGGSTTRNVRLDTLERYPSVLHQMLKERMPNKKVEVLNAGMDWYTSKHSNINYAVYCRDFQPDVVVLMHGINDLYRSFSPPSLAVGDYKSDYTHFYGPSIAGAQPPTFESIINQVVRKFWFAPTHEPTDFNLEKFKSIQDFQKYMGGVIELVQNDGAEIILVSQPYFYKASMTPAEDQVLWMDRGMCLIDGKYPNSQSMAMAMDAYNAKVAELSSIYQTKFVHGEPALPKDLDHFVDDVHYTTEGARKLAGVIAQEILK